MKVFTCRRLGDLQPLTSSFLKIIQTTEDDRRETHFDVREENIEYFGGFETRIPLMYIRK